MAYPPSTPSWPELALLRRRGQRPVGTVFLSDDWQYRQWMWHKKGIYTLPIGGDPVLLAGLRVVLHAKRSPEMTEYAQEIVGANPHGFQVDWEGEGWQCVI